MADVMETVLKAYRDLYGGDPVFFSRAPGRVNLIGDHTDYNEGWVLPAAISQGTFIAAAPSERPALEIHAIRMAESIDLPLDGKPLPKQSGAAWANYFLAVAEEFRDRGHQIPGLRAVVDSTLPLGAGLSSSASLEVAFAALLNEMIGLKLPPRDIALIGQAAEHSPYVGVQCGIMDQFAIALATARHALLLDCRSLETRQIPFPADEAGLLIINSGKQRGLVDSEYNQRRRDCEEGLTLLRKLTGRELPSLRDVTPEMLDEHSGALPGTIPKRLRHVISENERVLRCAEALERGDLAAAGSQFFDSHTSLTRDYEVSCPELNEIVDAAGVTPGVFGCRMTGAGFGGCAVALLEPDAELPFCEAIAKRYAGHGWIAPSFYPVELAGGAECFPLSTA